jgi:hypothetical protein
MGSGAGVLDYREFCTRIVDPSDNKWFLRLIDFYHDADKAENLQVVRKTRCALEDLRAAVTRMSTPP